MSSQQLAVGLGCDRGTSYTTVAQALVQALNKIGATAADINCFASIDVKADEQGLLTLANTLGKPIVFYRAEELAEVAVPNPSETVRKYVGTPAVSEAACLLAAKRTQEFLIVEKHKYCGSDGKNATVSIARI